MTYLHAKWVEHLVRKAEGLDDLIGFTQVLQNELHGTALHHNRYHNLKHTRYTESSARGLFALPLVQRHLWIYSLGRLPTSLRNPFSLQQFIPDRNGDASHANVGVVANPAGFGSIDYYASIDWRVGVRRCVRRTSFGRIPQMVSWRKEKTFVYLAVAPQQRNEKRAAGFNENYHDTVTAPCQQMRCVSLRSLLGTFRGCSGYKEPRTLWIFQRIISALSCCATLTGNHRYDHAVGRFDNDASALTRSCGSTGRLNYPIYGSKHC